MEFKNDIIKQCDEEITELKFKIKQLEDEFEMLTKERDERVHELYEANEENHKLKQTIWEINEIAINIAFDNNDPRLVDNINEIASICATEGK